MKGLFAKQQLCTCNRLATSRPLISVRTVAAVLTKRVYRAFSHDVTAAILVFQNNETAAMLVYQQSPL